MNELRNLSRPSAGSAETPAEKCPLCGRPITLLYPEIRPGVRYAHCQHGHKIRLRTENSAERSAG